MMKARTKNYLAFGLGVFSATQVRIVGAMNIAEIVLLLGIPGCLMALQGQLRGRKIAPILLLCLGWVVSAVVTGVMRGTLWVFALKGCFTALLVLADILGFYWLFYDDVMRYKWFGVGCIISTILSMFIFRPLTQEVMLAMFDYSAVGMFKVVFLGAISNILGCLTLLLYTRRNLRYLVMILNALWGVVCLLQGARSGALIFILGSMLLFFFESLPHDPVARGRFLKRNLLLFAAVAMLGGWMIGEGYKFAATHGFLSADETKKYEEQSSSKIGLLSGRWEFIAGLMAIRDSPILGYGSFAHDPGKGYAIRVAELLDAPDLILAELHDEEAHDMLFIPAHSFIWQAWLWNGMLGGLFWIYILIFYFQFLRNAAWVVPDLTGMFIIGGVSWIWSILFSPICNRPFIAANIAIMAIVWDIRRHWLVTGNPNILYRYWYQRR